MFCLNEARSPRRRAHPPRRLACIRRPLAPSLTAPPGPPLPQYIEANYKKLAFKQHLLRAALKSGATKGTFVQVKASFKLSEAAKKGPAKKKVRVAVAVAGGGGGRAE